MTTDTTYNGYANYETWNIALWIDNDEGSQDYWRENVQQIWNDATGNQYQTREQRARYTLAEVLKDEYRENMPDLDGTYADLLGAALSSVNWYEIAQNLLEEVETDEDEEEDDE